MVHQRSNPCVSPFYMIDQTTGEMIACPCQRCPACLKRRAAGWAFRLQQEEKNSDSSMFVTLTYDTRYIPITKQGTFTLDKRDIQLFIKRLRWNTIQQAKDSKRATLPIKYFAAGEYGSENFRPHYHIILFNCSHSEVLKSWKDIEKNQPLGNIHFGTVTPASIAYTLKYMLKSGRKFSKKDLRKPEFQLMSKQLGIAYLNAKSQLWHTNQNDRMYLTTEQNQKIAMPRYYKEKLYSKAQREEASKHLQELLQKDVMKMDFQKIMDSFETTSQRRERTINMHHLMNKNTDKNDKL